MNAQTLAPSLFGGRGPTAAPRAEMARQPRTLVDLMYDGFYLLFLLKNRNPPQDAAVFTERVKDFLDKFEREAKKLQVSPDEIYAAKYAFCAAVDETVLASQFNIRSSWERQPLQLVFFRDQLAGENFFVMLESLRQQGAARLQALEVFHLCLLLGFQGKYLLEGPEKLGYLTSRLGDEIAHLKGKRAQFAPFWMLPDQIKHLLKNEIPLWIIVSVFALVGVLAFLGLDWLLTRETEQALLAYNNVVQLAPRAAHVTITLP